MQLCTKFVIEVNLEIKIDYYLKMFVAIYESINGTYETLNKRINKIENQEGRVLLVFIIYQS